VLLAPAFEFGRTTFGTVDAAGIDRWRQSGWLEVYHWGVEAPRSVHFGLYEDAQLYDSGAERVSVPTLVFQGSNDAVVDPAMVQRLVTRQPTMSIRMVHDDHLLMENIDMIVRETAAFLGVP
jgi:pimeloyl-ACP methyl ester carboxylesterase